MAEEQILADMGLLNDGEDKILKFLNKIYDIPFENNKRWSAEIQEFFSQEFILPYVRIIGSDEEELDDIKEVIKSDFFSPFLGGGTLFWDDGKIYKSLIDIHKSVNQGKMPLRAYYHFFFINNIILRKMYIKKTDYEDTSFSNYKMQMTHKEYINDINGKNYYDRIHILIPDSSIKINEEKYCKEIFEIGKRKIKSKTSKKKKGRDPIESRLRHEVFKRDLYKCQECGKNPEETTLHVDHIKPVSKGGTDELENLQTLCQACNLAKSDKEWRAKNDS